MTKTNSGLLAYAMAQVGNPYWYGTYGQTATAALHAAKKKQYPDNYTASDFPSQYGKRVHDCVGIIKGYIWSDSPTGTPKYNAAQDKSARGMYAAAEVKGKIDTFPGKPGMLVFKGSSPTEIYHVGVYDGEGYVYEAKGHAYGTVKTAFKAAQWPYWAQCPYTVADEDADGTQEETQVEAAPEAVTAVKEPSCTVTLPLLRKGDSGEGVEALQILLKAKGYGLGSYGPNKDGVDGDFGKATENAVEAFQEDVELDVDGVVGSQTWAALIAGR